jgi:hypothetical protein
MCLLVAGQLQISTASAEELIGIVERRYRGAAVSTVTEVGQTGPYWGDYDRTVDGTSKSVDSDC